MRGDKLKIDLNNLFKSPAEAATIAGVPNPFSSLQRLVVEYYQVKE